MPRKKAKAINAEVLPPEKVEKEKEVSFDERKETPLKFSGRMTKSAEAVLSLEEEAKETVKFVSISIVQLCRENKLKPGWALLGVCEFLALMVHQNMTPAQYQMRS